MVDRQTIENQIDEFVKDNFPSDFKFREYQKEKIIDIIYNIVGECENHNHVIEAPTGSGKSLIVIISAGVLAKYHLLSSYILCSDLYLWDQYAEVIKKRRLKDFGMIKGQTGNYECSINHEDMRNADCRMGGIAWSSLFDKSKAESLGYPCAAKCEYVKARKKAVRSKVVLMTYQLFLYQINVVTKEMDSHNSFTNRPVIFCDECHNIPDIVSSKMQPSIQKSDFNKLREIYNFIMNEKLTLFADQTTTTDFSIDPDVFAQMESLFDDVMSNEKTTIAKDIAAINTYIGDIVSKFTVASKEILIAISKKKSSKKQLSKDESRVFKCVTWLQNYMCHWNDFCGAIASSGPEYFLKRVEEDFDKNKVVKYNCTKEDWMVYNYILSQADWKVMLSATVGGKISFAEQIGAKYTQDEDIKFDVIPSTFDFSKSPIEFYSAQKMTFQEKEKAFKAIEPMVFKICMEEFKDKKGIIQTGNYTFARNLFFDAPKELADRLLIYNGSKEKSSVINKHRRSKNTILIGPTLMEGVDLPDDDCRFIIIMKVPYPNMGDKLVSAKMKLFPTWYNSKTSNMIIQGIGRGVRNPKDWCKTYILDGCFYSLYTNTKEQYAQELQERINFH